jgi:hypothetical protein
MALRWQRGVDLPPDMRERLDDLIVSNQGADALPGAKSTTE